MIVATLGINATLSVAGIIVLPLYGKEIPQALVVTVGTLVGALASFLVQPPRGSIGGGGNSSIQQERTTVTTISQPAAKESQ